MGVFGKGVFCPGSNALFSSVSEITGYLAGIHWKKLTCSTICRRHGISVELVWNHENSILIPYRGSFKFHNTYAETGYKLWN